MILYEDHDLIVCHKPAGIPVQSARIGTKDMISILNNYLAEKNMADREVGRAKKEHEMIHVVHRLDQPVEGVLVFAKTQRAASELGRQISKGSMKKVYYAICCVTDKAKQGLHPQKGSVYRLVDYLVKNGRTNISSVAKKNDRDAKCARLSFLVADIKETEETGQGKSRAYLLARIDLETGRHHQIRVQMAKAGLPLYGDRKYHESWQDYLQPQYEKSGQTGLALCAASLTFDHPVTKKKMMFEVKPQAEIFHMFDQTGLWAASEKAGGIK